MKILIHFSHYETLGHTMRIRNICQYLRRQNNDAQITVLQAGQKQEFVNFEGVNIVHLPDTIVGRDWIISSKRKIIDPGKIRRRVHFTLQFIKKYQPDVFLIEYFPFGRDMDRYEILPILKYIKDNNLSIRIYSSIGYPILNFDKKNTLKYAEYFDKILIHSPKKLDKQFIESMYKKIGPDSLVLRDYQEVFEILKDKIVFTNYILPIDIVKKKIEEARADLDIDKEFILASRGGGVMCPKIITSSLLSRKYLACDVIAVTGPASTGAEQKLFSQLSLQTGSKVISYTPHLLSYLNACSVSVSMSGYNSIVQTLFMQKPSVLFPRVRGVGLGGIEQAYRVELLNTFLRTEALSYSSFTTENLAEKINLLLDKNPVKKEIDPDFFLGGKHTAKFIVAE